MESTFHRKVADYMLFNSSTPKVSWRSAGELGLTNNIRLQELLANKIVLCSNEEDYLIWSASKLGKNKVNLGYELLRHRYNKIYWHTKLCWEKWPMPKAGAFLWVALQGRIFPRERLKYIGFQDGTSASCLKERKKQQTIFFYGVR